MAKKLSTDELKKIQDQARKLVSQNSERDLMFDEIQDMYWMETSETVNKRDSSDVKMTISPSARNEVVGMVRLLTTNNPHFSATGKEGDPDKVEKALESIIKRSNEVTLTKLATEAARSAVLYSDVHIMIELVDDMLAVDGLPEYEKKRLEEIRSRTPFLVSVLSPREGYPLFGRTGLRAYLRKYKAQGADIRERWGVEDLDDDQDYTVYDWYGMEYRAVWLEEKSEPLSFAEHGLSRIPIVVMISDGTNLFREEEYKRHPFLYAKWKGEWWKRENLLYTTLFTSMFERGTGPLVGIDPESLGPDKVLDVNYAGPFRYIIAKAQLLNDKAFDADLLGARGLLEQVSGESTIYKQTLGENVGGSNTSFSALAMLSQSGRLPLVSAQDTIAAAFREMGNIIIRWIKAENVKNTWIKASEIGSDLEIDCGMEVKLPQDMFRNAQIAASLKGVVSNEWIHTNLLQIDDSNEMRYEVWSEAAADSFFQLEMQRLAEQAKQAFIAAQQQQQMAMQGQRGPAQMQGIPPNPAQMQRAPQQQGQAIDPRIMEMMSGGSPQPGQPGQPGQNQGAMRPSRLPSINQSGEKMPLSGPIRE